MKTDKTKLALKIAQDAALNAHNHLHIATNWIDTGGVFDERDAASMIRSEMESAENKALETLRLCIKARVQFELSGIGK